MIKLIDICKTYNPHTVNETKLFENFNLSINPGDFVSVIGSNGSGKTTMLNLICGSIPLDKGTILINNQKINTLKEFERYKTIGRVYQDPSKGTCPTMTILENMSLADNKNRSFNLSWGTNKKRIDYYKELLSQLNLGLEDKLGVKVGLLSGGQRQAMALLMTTMSPIEILILDEHTAALDPKTAAKVLDLTVKIVEEEKLTAMMVTHNMKDALRIGNRLIMLHNGNIILDLSKEEKQNMEVSDLLKMFERASGEEMDNDRMLLG